MADTPQTTATELTAVLREAYVSLAFAIARLSSSARTRDTELCSSFAKVRARIERAMKDAGHGLS